jgi:hypothetical protein
MQDLTAWAVDPKGQLQTAAGINASGQIVGTGTFQGLNGQPTTAVFLATPTKVLPIPKVPDLLIRILIGVTSGGSGIGVTGGGHVVPVPSPDPVLARRELSKQGFIGGLVLNELARAFQQEQARRDTDSVSLDTILRVVELLRRGR